MSASEKTSIKWLEEELERIQQGQVFEYLSRWSFERLLDRLASCVRDRAPGRE